MRAIGAKPTKTLSIKTRFEITDNSGGKEAELIAVRGFKGKKRTKPKAGIASMVFIAIKKGKPELRKKVERAVVVRTKKEYMRKTGIRVKFEDNAVVLVDEKGIPKASEIKGAIAKESAERFPKLAGIASVIV